jgi:hypothetical protein
MEIYDLKSRQWGRQTALSLAQRYGVTTKAVRDIWRGRTWSDVTSESRYRLKRDAVRCEAAKCTVKRRKISDDCKQFMQDTEKVKRLDFVSLIVSSNNNTQ